MSIGVGHPRTTIDLVTDHPRRQQRRIEAVAGMREMGLSGSGPEPRIDAHEQQFQPRTNQIGHGRVSERFELGARETHRPDGTPNGQYGGMGHPHWPLFDLEVATPRLTLRYIDDELATALVDLAASGIHAPDFMPFAMGWTDVDPDELGPACFRYWWRCRTDTSTDSWEVNLAVIENGRVVGATGLIGRQFPVTRWFETGSWLGLEHQGRGLGTELRIATLHLGFLGFDAVGATTGAFADNGPSLGVTHKLGYEPNGIIRNVRRGESADTHQFVMTRRHFGEHVRRDDITISGDEGARRLLDISR